MLAMMLLHGVLVTYASGNEIGREKFVDDGKQLRSELSVMGRHATVTVTRAPRHATVEQGAAKVEREVPADTVVLENLAWQEYALAAEWFPDAKAPTPVTVLVPGQGARVPGTIQVEPRPDGTRRVTVRIGHLEAFATVGKDGRVVEAEVPAQKLVAKPAGASVPVAATRQPPRDVVEEDVTVERPDATIKGVVWSPPGATKPPLAIVIAGSGPTDRDGNSGLGVATDCYRMLAEALVGKGVAVLRYDKRGAGASTLREDPAKLTFDDFVGDAAAMLAWARKSGRFGKITIVGHSEGSAIAARLGMMSDKPDAIVSLEGGGRSFGVLLREQLSTKIGARDLARFDEILAHLRAGKPLGDIPEGLQILFAPTVRAFMRSLIDVDPAKLYAAQKVPLDIVQGDTDAQIAVADAEALRKARPDAKLHIVHGCNHVLKQEPSRALPQRSYTDPKVPLCGGLVDAILDGIAR